MRGRIIAHYGVFVTGRGVRSGGGRELGGGRDVDWNPGWADSSRRGRCDKAKETVNGGVNAMVTDGINIRS